LGVSDLSRRREGGQKLADKWEEKKMFALLRLMGLQEYGLDWTQDYPVSADGLSWPSPGTVFDAYGHGPEWQAPAPNVSGKDCTTSSVGTVSINGTVFDLVPHNT